MPDKITKAVSAAAQRVKKILAKEIMVRPYCAKRSRPCRRQNCGQLLREFRARQNLPATRGSRALREFHLHMREKRNHRRLVACGTQLFQGFERTLAGVQVHDEQSS